MPNWIEAAQNRIEAIAEAARKAKIKAGNDAEFGGYNTVEDTGGVKGRKAKRKVNQQERRIGGHATVAVGKEGQIEAYPQKSEFEEVDVTVFNRKVSPQLKEDVAGALRRNRDIIAEELNRRVKEKAAKKSA